MDLPPANWRFIRSYLTIAAIGNLLWEVLQQPFYTLWRIASPAYVAFAIIHCWIGDLMIASFSLALGIIASRSLGSKRFFPAGVIVSVLAGVSYTIFSEWQNMSVHHFWTYSAYMPRLPIVGTGLLPILQWILVPAIALYCARKSPLTLVTVA